MLLPFQVVRIWGRCELKLNVGFSFIGMKLGKPLSKKIPTLFLDAGMLPSESNLRLEQW
jgi:hypothetical protein